MPFYRIYTVTADGHIKKAPWNVMCDDDEAAIDHARSLKDGLDLEVWQGKRRIAVLRSKPDE